MQARRIATTLVSFLVVCLAASSAQALRTKRVSIKSNGGRVNDDSNNASISDNGRFVVFYSESDDLSVVDNNGFGDVYLRDRGRGRTILVSRPGGGGDANGISGVPAISGDGAWIAYTSDADNLSNQDDNNVVNIFLYNRVSRTTRFIHRSTAGVEANADVYYFGPPALSRDGRFIAYGSSAENLVPGDNNGYRDVFVYDRVNQRTKRVSIKSNGNQAQNGDSPVLDGPTISADGRFVAFDSEADNFSPNDNNGASDAWMYDRRNQKLELISRRGNGNAGNNGSFNPDVSPTGRYVAYETDADDLIPGGDDNANEFDIIVLDRRTNRREAASLRPNGQQGALGSREASISTSGRYVAFESDSSLHPGDPDNDTDVYIRDLRAGRTLLVSRNRQGGPANGFSNLPVLTPDGEWVAFHSDASNLIANDGNNDEDVFVRGPF
jgi:Tol biopolymer transport system component